MKTGTPPKVISASRRTDIPAFYMDWFMDRIRVGEFAITNPYNRKTSRLAVSPEQVHSIVLWSKDFGPMLRDGHDRRLGQAGYRLFFNFTINSASDWLEPRVPPLPERLDQLQRLAERHDPRAITWRFDPICSFRRRPDREVEDNLADLEHIADHAARCGIERCVTSFVDLYPKIRRRLAPGAGAAFLDPPLERKTAVLLAMNRVLAARGIALFLCCEKEVLAALPQGCGITASACIPHDLLEALFGGRLSRRRDAGQRVKSGCRCGVSVDVGSYRDHPCRHNCLFCYANPSRDRAGKGAP